MSSSHLRTRERRRTVGIEREGFTPGRATVRMPGTCGELVQGALDGVTFLISCPIDVFSTVTVELAADGAIIAPADCPKAEAGLRAALAFFDREGLGVRLEVCSPLPRGKGLGSSTADIAGAIYALALALGQDIAAADVARLALSVEPTDGSLFPGLALFDHRDGRLCELLGPPPPVDIVMLDPGGEVDTVAFNRSDRSALLRELEPRVREALALVRSGLAWGRPDLIGQGATLSALANQRILYKPLLEPVLEIARSVGALGVSIGHSGTVIGVLLDPRVHDKLAVQARLERDLPALEALSVCRLIGGGCRPAS